MTKRFLTCLSTKAKGKWNNTDFYQLGYAYYKQNNFESAVSQFNKLSTEKIL
jgi:outer membrane protein assembly factor BamD (BamD/ComL family)